MIPFPGESAPLDWANVTAGAPFDDDGDAIRHRAGSVTVTAGDVFVAGFYDHNYLEPGEPAVFSAVVETLAGSGTLRLSGGPDVTWSLNDGPASAYSLGDHVVSGAGTIVVTLPWLNAADYLAEDAETAIRVEALSGSVVVQQVKLRIWPPTGVAGGWSAEPFDQASQVKPAQVSPIAAGTTAQYDNQPDMRAELAAMVATTTGTGGDYITSGQMLAYTDAFGTDVGGGFGVAYIARPPSNYTGPGFEEETWIVPPAEVWTDDDRVIFQPTGDDSFTWTQGAATVANDDNGNPGPAAGSFHIDATEVDERYPVGTLLASFVDGTPLTTVAGASGLTYSTVSMPEFDTLQLLVTIWHDGHFADIAETGGTQIRLVNGTTSDELTFDPLTYLWDPAPYRYWNPTAVPGVEPLRLRQRSDGLGYGSNRVRGVASRQLSVRVRGYL